jgi:peptide/nickel transport system permease protein
MVSVMLGLVLATFAMVRFVPGNPARLAAGLHANGAQVALIREQLGLDHPFWIQLWVYLGNVLRLHLGTSFTYGAPVTTILAQRLPKTAELAAVALALALLFSVPIGILMAALTGKGKHRWLENVFSAVSGLFASLPSFLFATFLSYIFAVTLHLLPGAGSTSPLAVALPAIAVALPAAAMLARIVRLEALRVFEQDYVRTARSKRLPIWRIYFRHVLPNVLAGTLTIGGVFFAQMIGGVVVVENVFGWPGLGTTIVGAVISHDYPLIQGVALLLGATMVVVNALVDVALSFVDPKTLVRA